MADNPFAKLPNPDPAQVAQSAWSEREDKIRRAALFVCEVAALECQNNQLSSRADFRSILLIAAAGSLCEMWPQAVAAGLSKEEFAKEGADIFYGTLIRLINEGPQVRVFDVSNQAAIDAFNKCLMESKNSHELSYNLEKWLNEFFGKDKEDGTDKS